MPSYKILKKLKSNYFFLLLWICFSYFGFFIDSKFDKEDRIAVSVTTSFPGRLSEYISYKSYYEIFFSLFHKEQWFHSEIEEKKIEVISNKKNLNNIVKKLNLNFDVGLPVITFSPTKSYANYMKGKAYNKRKKLQYQVAEYLGTVFRLYTSDDVRSNFYMFERLQQDSKIDLLKFKNKDLNCTLEHREISQLHHFTFISKFQRNHKECKKIITSQIIQHQLIYNKIFLLSIQNFKQDLARNSINPKWNSSDPKLKKILEIKNRRFSKYDEDKIKKIIFQKENNATIIAILNQFEEFSLLYNKKYMAILNSIIEKNVVIEEKTEKKIFLNSNRFLIFFLFIPVYLFIFFYLFNIKFAFKKKYKI